jgi:hypothetical protein
MKDEVFRRTSRSLFWLGLIAVLSFLVPVEYDSSGSTPLPCLSGESERINGNQIHTAFSSVWSLMYWGHVEVLPILTTTYESAAASYAGVSVKRVHWRWKVFGWVLLPVFLAGCYVYRSTFARLHRLTK